MSEHIGAEEAQRLLDAATPGDDWASEWDETIEAHYAVIKAAPRALREVVRLRRELDAEDDGRPLADHERSRCTAGHVRQMAEEYELLEAERDELRRERDDYREAFSRILDGDAYPVGSTIRRFELHRDEDVSGVSGTGVVAEGVAFSNDGPVALRWLSDWPTSVVFHDRGVESLEAVHGHNGRTRIFWLDPSVLGGGE